MRHKAISLSFMPSEAETRGAMVMLGQLLRSHNLAASDVERAELVLTEVLNNVVEHAMAKRSGQISAKIDIGPDALWCCVTDAGMPMPQGGVPSGRRVGAVKAISDLPEGGFGWFLIHALTTDLRYHRSTSQNQLAFSIPLETRLAG